MITKFLKIMAVGGMSLFLVTGLSAQVIPTNVWTDFYGSAGTYNGVALPVGSVINAYDPQAILCGSDTVRNAGQYGFLPVYGDDAMTPEDEGAEIDDIITFTINGRLAVKHGPDSSAWTGMGLPKEVNLSASAAISMELVSSPISQYASPKDTIHYAVTVKNTGQGIDFYRITATSSNGWLVQPQFGFSYALPNGNAVVHFDLLIPALIFEDTSDVIHFRVSSGIDTSVYVEDSVTTYVAITDAPETPNAVPSGFRLNQNYPNPFNPVTTIAYSLPARASVRLGIFNLLGQKLVEYNLGSQSAGNHVFQFSGDRLSSGVYFYRLSAGESSAVRKMILMK
ncbi:exported hypothetical protein [Candidatus Zixiibacteriota bacterium]|nr:exported hypothetical protein [candidate division Zixibacteria bacterium]